jgi:diacylglycerol kinase (ATP)
MNDQYPPSSFKSRGGLGRIANAIRYSLSGLRAAWRHEAAFKQELMLALPLLASIPWLAPGRWQAVAMSSSLLLVLIVELLNSGLEAIADAVSVDHHPLLGRAKDLGSAAVMLSLVFAAVVWAVVLWP